jgi:lipopolysaccharide export system protein LptC
MALLFGGYMWNSSPLTLAVSGDSSFTEGKLVMANPKLEGFAKNGRPYLMTAVRAVQNFEQQNVIVLEGINAKMPVDAENWAMIAAEGGVLDRATNTLTLNTDVTVTTTNGMNARLKSAVIDISTGNIKTADPVDIHIDDSKIVADSMSVAEGGKLLVFENHVRMNIDPQQMKASNQASGGTDASN